MRSYLKAYVRWYFYENGNFNNLPKKIVKEVSDEATKKRISVDELLYRTLGYKKDSNLSSLQRFKLSKEVSENLFNKFYWIDKAKEMGVERTSKVVEKLSELGVLGVGAVNTSAMTCPYVFSGFYNFLVNHKELVDVFCKGADFIESPLCANDRHLTYKELKDSVFIDKTYDGFCDTLKRIGIEDPKVLLKINKRGSKVIFTTQCLNVPSKMIKNESLSFVSTCLIYAYLINADKISPYMFNQAYKACQCLRNPFIITDEQSTDLLSISYNSGMTVSEIALCYGIVLPKMSECLELSDGLFTRVTYSLPNGNNCIDIIYYLPSYSKGIKDFPTKIVLDDFMFLLQKNLEVEFRDGVPYVNGSPAIVKGV